MQLLIGIANRKVDDIAVFCNWLIDQAPRTERGMLYLSEKYSAKYAGEIVTIAWVLGGKLGEINAKNTTKTVS